MLASKMHEVFHDSAYFLGKRWVAFNKNCDLMMLQADDKLKQSAWLDRVTR